MLPRLMIVDAGNSPILVKYVMYKKSPQVIHSIPTVFQNHDRADATSLLTCIQLVGLVMVMHS